MRTQVSDKTKLVTSTGHRLQVESFISSGGQGEVYRVLNKSDGQYYALKLYHKSKATAVALERTKHLVGLKLGQLDARICAPFDIVSHNGLVGHISEFVDGSTLLEALESGDLSFVEAFDVALSIVDIMESFRGSGVIYGDIQSQNFKVESSSNDICIKVIDLDNYSSKGAPHPEMVGMTLYMAPELRERLLAEKRVYPTELSDRFALGVLLHEVLLHFHPISGLDGTAEEINDAMLSGWAYDPDSHAKPATSHGYPVESLNEELIGLLRRSLSSVPSRRPKPSEWQIPLKRAVGEITTCFVCGVPFVLRQNQATCPFSHSVSQLALCLKNRQVIPINRSTTVLGRKELGGSKNISRRHILLRRIGSGVYVESIGLNPTCIRSGGAWQKLAPNEIRKLAPDDQLLIAGEELNYKRI